MLGATWADFLQRKTDHCPTLSQPTPLLLFSIDAKSRLFFDQRSCSTLTSSPALLGADLRVGIEHWKRKKGVEYEYLDALLFSVMQLQIPIKRPAFVTWRGLLTKLMLCMNDTEPFALLVQVHRDVIYIAEDRSERSEQAQNSRQQEFMYSGYAFEALCANQTLDNGVDENVQFGAVIKTSIGNLRILAGGEIDGVMNGQWHELKTSSLIKNGRAHQAFEKKLMRIWAQSFLMGVPAVTVGFRDEEMKLRTIQTFNTAEIPKLVVTSGQKAWDAMACLTTLDMTLNWIRTLVHDNKGQFADDQVQRLQFDREGLIWASDPVIISKPPQSEGEGMALGEEERQGFLPRSYVAWTQSAFI